MSGSMVRSIAMLMVATSTLAAQPTVVKEEKAGLLKAAKIQPAAAMATALAKVPGGKIQSAEIEREDGKLVYAFDIKVPNKAGIEEVLVDAATGAVVSVSHETPADEAKEAKPVGKAAPTPRKPPRTAGGA